jgi:hypothetical protein
MMTFYLLTAIRMRPNIKIQLLGPRMFIALLELMPAADLGVRFMRYIETIASPSRSNSLQFKELRLTGLLPPTL